MSFNYGTIDKGILERLVEAKQARQERRRMSDDENLGCVVGLGGGIVGYELAQKDYPAVDMFALEGEHFSQYIEKDLRQIAIASGYPISPEPGVEDELDWADRVTCRINLIEEGDGTRVYRSTLESYSEMVKAG